MADVIGNIHPGLMEMATALDTLTMLEPNPNVGDVEAVRRSYKQFGQRKPIVVRESDRVIIAGNTQWMAAGEEGWTHIAALFVDDDEATSLAFAMADNHTADLGQEDGDALLFTLQRIYGEDAALLAAASYSEKDIARLLAAQSPDTSPQLSMHYQVLIDCEDEQQQRVMLEKFSAEGYTVRALTV